MLDIASLVYNSISSVIDNTLNDSPDFAPGYCSYGSVFVDTSNHKADRVIFTYSPESSSRLLHSLIHLAPQSN